ncbi:kirola-like [Hibiscus syriacus]|uniref:kirola-like n=1 Tax=Hibiscus syriacus TaxID=106335 RepID=UPI0019207047|nr:kirola-like [Hibiscus syriacus]
MLNFFKVIGTPSALSDWSYVSQRKSQVVKEILEDADEENKRMVFRLVEGDLLRSYDNWRNILNIRPTGEGTLVKWTMEFEKQNQDIPDPVEYAASLIALTQNIDAYFLNTSRS